MLVESLCLIGLKKGSAVGVNGMVACTLWRSARVTYTQARTLAHPPVYTHKTRRAEVLFAECLDFFFALISEKYAEFTRSCFDKPHTVSIYINIGSKLQKCPSMHLIL